MPDKRTKPVLPLAFQHTGSESPTVSEAPLNRQQRFTETLLLCLREHLSGLEQQTEALHAKERQLLEQYQALYPGEPSTGNHPAEPSTPNQRRGHPLEPSTPHQQGSTLFQLESLPLSPRTPVHRQPSRESPGTSAVIRSVASSLDERYPLGHPVAIPRVASDEAKLSRRFSRALSAVSSHKSSEARTAKTSSSAMDVELAACWVDMAGPRKTLSRLATRGQTQGFGLNPKAALRSVSSLSQNWEMERSIGLHGCMVLHPLSRRRLIVDISGIACIMFDAVITPLRAFDLPSSAFFHEASYLTSCFWILDLLVSCVTGYRKEGVVQRQVLLALLNYAKTWLFFDLALLCLDSIYLFMVPWERNWSFGGLAGWIGLARLLRLGKLPFLLNRVLERAQSDLALILIDIVKLMVFILFTTHVIACVWFQIGTLERSRDDGYTWVHEFELSSRPTLYHYTTALHWSVTQFTPASMEIVPTNEVERIFTVAVVIFALLSFSSIVSSITNAMTRLRHRDKERLDEYALLRRFLAERGVRTDLVGGIWGHINRVWSRSQRRMHISEVKILELVPRSLHSDLQHEVFAPTFAWHPFFQQFAKTNELGMRRLYQTALSEVSLSTGMELFTTGDSSFHMYLVAYGEFDYEVACDDFKVKYSRRDTTTKTDFDGAPVHVGAWVAEASLWLIKWMHQGILTAKKQSEVVAVSADRFQKLVKRDVVGCLEVTKYASEYVAVLKHDQDANDIWGQPDVIESLARKAFRKSENSRST